MLKLRNRGLLAVAGAWFLLLALGPGAQAEFVFQKRFVLGQLEKAVQPSPEDFAKGRLQVGLRRDFSAPAVVNHSSVSSAEWKVLPDGSRVWAAEIIAEGAKGIRVHVRGIGLPPGTMLMVYAPDQKGPTRAVNATELGETQELWMPSVLSERLIFECRVPESVDTKDVAFTLDGISHLYDSPVPSLAKVGGCHNDVSCFDAWKDAAAGVGRITFVENGNTFLCSGSLLGSTSGDPYFLTANHCVPNQTVASTFEVYWLFQTSRCDGAAPALSEVPQTAGGADFVAGSSANDFALLRLRRSPPPGVLFLAWSIQPAAVGEAVATVHHPGGSYKRISLGAKIGADSDFTKVRWSSGVTEPGSSGAPLFNSRREVIGQLYGGSSSCGNPSGADLFGRLDVTHQTIKVWLEGGTMPGLPNPVPEVQVPRGTYAGLFQKPDGFSANTSGTLNLTLAANRRFSGNIRMTSGLHRLSGRFDAAGSAEVLVPRGEWPTLRLELSVNSSDGDRISGRIGAPDWTSAVSMNRSVYDGRRQVAPQAGRYTLAFPQDGRGDAIATCTINKAGRVAIAGKLPGGPSWTRAGFVSRDGDFPLLSLIRGGQQMLTGWITFGAGYWSAPSGAVNWAIERGHTTYVQVRGSRYSPPGPTEPVLGSSEARLALTGEGMNAVFSLPLGPKRKISAPGEGAQRISIVFNANGRFSGRAAGLPGGSSVYFSGVVLQNEGAGFGAFSTATGEGSVRLSAQNY